MPIQYELRRLTYLMNIQTRRNSIPKWVVLGVFINSVFVLWLSTDLVNTKESLLPASENSYHMNNRKAQNGEEVVVLWNYA